MFNDRRCDAAFYDTAINFNSLIDFIQSKFERNNKKNVGTWCQATNSWKFTECEFHFSCQLINVYVYVLTLAPEE